jgi:phthiocerol/phenolphthiocerol synthesis type-I polyketide synthase C
MSGPFVHHLRDDIAVVGWACRLPGAKSVNELWSLLLEERCAISRVPDDRFPLERFGHPRRQERGKSYTWAAGILDDVWGFDPAVFGISPREAIQIDPQQRILLQLTWEALEDAGIRPSSIANSEVGVFVGASQTDYGHAFFGDPAVADAHFAPGTALAILANRISYVYGLHGPSITVDTACSSSLVALHQAVEALRAGRIDTAIVGGSNLIASPASFIAFSQANMLSPKGLCQAFSATADGFVRAEGAVVFVLRKSAFANAKQNPIRGLVLASDVNSDGRTNGISLPSLDAQEALLRRIYARNNIDFDRLAFVEAHGTGTPVGDPVEANAIGRSIARNRSDSLPIGSIKTNIGHLEPASGLAGVLKALLALNHGILPPSLHFTEPNPHIEFDALNLSVCTQPLLLPNSADQYAGVNSFGFGGTNAHAVVAAGRKSSPPLTDHAKSGSGIFAFSADSSAALAELARQYAELVSQQSDGDTATLASAIIHRRERQSNRVVVSGTRTQDVAQALNAFISGNDHPKLTAGTAVGNEMPVAFVYSGNGSQWVGMGLSAYRNNAQFRARFEQVDGYFKEIGGWSLKDALFSDMLAERLPLTSIAQPLIFGIQSACTAALRASGLRPAAVLGHSVGEVAAAEAAGILDLRTAIKVIHFRSTHQELIHAGGRMAAVLGSAESVQHLADEIEGVEIAAINGPRAVTVAGPTEALARFKRLAADRGIALLDLDLDYPFHTALMAPIERHLRVDLRDIAAHDADVPFVSTVTGACLPGSRLDGNYWWRNVREPVQFAAAVRAAAELGARYFVEIGPRPTLLKHIVDSLYGEVNGFAALAVLDRSDEDADPFDRARAKAIVAGARIDTDKIFGPDPGPGVLLPHYPWQQSQFRFKPTVEALGNETERHPFAGARSSADTVVWHSHIDTMLYPKLVDHKLGEQTIFPGTGFVEIALAVARQWLRTETVITTDFEILNPLDLTSGETREMMTRVSPGSSTLEIFSRPRLSQVTWLLHCRCKIQTGNAADTVSGPDWPKAGRVLEGSKVYDIADASGLHYGPAFRLVQDATIYDTRFIGIELAPSSEETPFVLDPMRLDCSAHGFFTVFPELRAVERGVTYIPVRLEEVALYRPHIAPVRALIEIVSKSERSIVGNCHIYGANGEIIAVLRGVRSQAVTIRRSSSLEAVAFVELPHFIDGSIVGQTGVAATTKDVVASASSLGIVAGGLASSSEPEMLIEGWATAAAYEIASGLADDGVVDVDTLVVSGRIPESLRNWIVNILVRLEAAELAKQERAAWTLINDWSLPSSTSVVKALATEQQSRAAETLLAAAISGFAKQVASSADIPAPDSIISKAALDFYCTTSIALREASDTLYRVLLENNRLWPKNRALRVLQVGFGNLAHSLLSSQRDILLTIFEPDRRRYEGAELALSKNREIRLVDAEHSHELAQYDLIVGVLGLHRLPARFGFADLKGLLAPGGLLVAVEPKSSLFKDMIFGLDADWFLTGAADRPVSPLRPLKYWPAKLDEAGFCNSQASLVRCGSDLAYLVVAEAGRAAMESSAVAAPQLAPATESTALLVASTNDCPLVDKLKVYLAKAKLPASMTVGLSDYPAVAPDTVVLVPAFAADPADSVATLTRRCLEIKACAEKIGAGPATLWLVFSGALAAESSQVRPVEAGAWAFSRTLANEFPKLDVRRIDIAPNVLDDAAARQIQRILISGTNETELHVDAQTIRAVRVEALKRALDSKASTGRTAAKLERRSASGQRLSWQPVERKRPNAGEVEIEVEAAGLNFRDLMWSLSLLPEDMLEDGFSGATLGLECAGRVIRVGPSVENVKVGDRVMAFAASSFATHVTVKSGQAVKIPERMPIEAAATIPVAFFTTYYSLVTLAKLARREWVLIHGGAGAVGMAAIQIAKSRGARVIATAGSPAKRDLLRSLGASHVLDSRSTTFVDDIRKITGSGVDVVLNSLAGEAMERSIACMRPFGRFVELGKRDYVTNTHIGLRPFRKNLAYFGVDVDQVIGARRAAGDRIFSKIVQQFEKGTYVPLPYSVFDADNVSEAFHLMQQSGHIGKIVVRPPSKGLAGPAKKPFQVSVDKTHIITGAFGGFGLETAKWLVDKGARYLVMIGRRGAAAPEAQAVVNDLIARGVKVVADPCDITDWSALERLFEMIHFTMPPIAGVIHEAMVLDDSILANLDAERFNRVLAPKVTGAENLNYLVRGRQLDYFVLFSSVTTLIGNPGQGNYVAANAYMEGLARRRRQKGLPALAIGWGPITDVGVVARNQQLQSGLQKLTGVMGMRAREALELMAQALEQPSDIPDTAVMTISPNEGSFNSERLAVLRSPTYAAYLSGGHRSGESGAESIDLHALAASDGVEAARRKVADVISSQLAHVLHLREEDINHVRPLGEIGLDSLMALELVMNLEKCFGIHIPLSGSSGGMTIADIADEIIAHVGLGRDREDAVVATLAEQHHGEVDVVQLETLKGMMNEEARTSKRLLS